MELLIVTRAPKIRISKETLNKLPNFIALKKIEGNEEIEDIDVYYHTSHILLPYPDTSDYSLHNREAMYIMCFWHGKSWTLSHFYQQNTGIFLM